MTGWKKKARLEEKQARLEVEAELKIVRLEAEPENLKDEMATGGPKEDDPMAALVGQTYEYYPPTPPARSDTQLFGRETTRQEALSCLKWHNNMDRRVCDSGKFSVLGVSGAQGMGKTKLHKQICEKWVPEALGENSEAICVSHSGGGKAAGYCTIAETMEKHMTSGWIDSLGHLLLVSCGVDKRVATGVDFDSAIQFIRSQLGEDKSGQLVICVDGVVRLDLVNKKFNKDREFAVTQQIMSECMSEQDREKGELIFIFTAILNSMHTELSSCSSACDHTHWVSIRQFGIRRICLGVCHKDKEDQ